MSKYKDQVRAAAAALQRGEDANWELAQLTHEVCGPPGHRGRDKTYTSLEVWAKDVRDRSGRRFATITASYYRSIWNKFGIHSGVIQISWTEAYNDIRGVESMDANMVSTNFKRAIAHASPEQKREVFTTLAREPEVLNEALQDDRTRWDIQSVSRQIAVEKYPEAILHPVRLEPHDSTLDRRIFFAQLADKVDVWARELTQVREFLEWSGDVDQLRRWATRQALERLIDAAIACRDVLPSSYVDSESDVSGPTLAAG